VKKLKRGMRLLDRQHLREQVMERQLKLAVDRAAEYGLSQPCRQAMAMSLAGCPDRAAALHAECQAEEPGGTGCLCLCHDVRDTAVVTGCSG